MRPASTSRGYFEVRNLEDRLYIPGEYRPLFLENGWVERPARAAAPARRAPARVPA